MTEETAEDRTYRTTIFLNNGTRVMFNTKELVKASLVKQKFRFENLREGIPVEIRGFEEQKLIFVPSSISMVILEEVREGMPYHDDPLDRFVYH